MIDRHTEALNIFSDGAFIPATPLVLDAERQFDPKGQQKLVRYYLESGADGIAVAVHTTQFQIRKPEFALLKPVLKTVAEEMGRFEAKTGRTVVRVAGVCGDLPQAIEEAKLASAYGYDAILLSPGGLGELTEEELLERTRAVAAVLPVIGFYLQPAAGGRLLSYSYWRHFCEIENVIGIKCASFNRYSTVDVVRAAALSSRADKITLYTGNDDNIIIDLLTPYRFTVDGKTVEKRFQGGLLGHWSVCTKAAVGIFHRLKAAAKDCTIPKELLTLAAEVTDFNAAVFDAKNGFAGCIPGVHELLCRRGVMEGTWCLDPGEVMSPGQAEEIDRCAAMYPHLFDE